MKKLLCLLLITFALSLVVPSSQAVEVKAKPTLVKASKKNKAQAKRHHKRHHKKHKKA